jgi:hypothetical protein
MFQMFQMCFNQLKQVLGLFRAHLHVFLVVFQMFQMNILSIFFIY